MPSDLVLEGVPALAYFLSVNYSYSCRGEKGTSYTFLTDEPTGVYVLQDVKDFRENEALVECDKNGNELPGANHQEAKNKPAPRSYKRVNQTPKQKALPPEYVQEYEDSMEKEIEELERRRQKKLAQYRE